MTLQLPDALAPWRQTLSLFSAELAIELGGMVRRLASAIGPPVAARHRGDDPDGYDGIAQSGPYDRMLQSEWLLADEMPDEFLRRAIMREQLFFRIARRSPLDELFSVALLDAGPTQLGAPRVAHLALLIVLAQRCAERGGVFRWGVLQEHPRRVYERLDVDTVRAMLDLRSAHEVDEAALDEWLDVLPHGDQRHRETWMIGGPRLARLVERHARASEQGRDFRESAMIAIDEPLDSRTRVLQTRIQRGGGRTQELLLPLPSENATVRLLRDPFSVAPAPVVRTPMVPEEFFFTANGSNLIAREPRGGLLLYKLRDGARPKQYEPMIGYPVIGAGGGKQRGASLAITQSGRLILAAIHGQTNRELLKVPPSFPLDAEGERKQLHPMVPLGHYMVDYAFIDVHGTCWVTRVGKETVAPVAENVAALEMFGGCANIARRSGDEWVIEGVDGDKTRLLARYPGSGTRAFFGSPASDSEHDGLVMALEQSVDRWTVATLKEVHTVTCPPDARVIGVTALKKQPRPSLVYADRFTIFVSLGNTWETMVKATLPITAAVVDASGPRVAYRTGDELFVFALDQRKVIYRVGRRW